MITQYTQWDDFEADFVGFEATLRRANATKTVVRAHALRYMFALFAVADKIRGVCYFIARVIVLSCHPCLVLFYHQCDSVNYHPCGTLSVILAVERGHIG